VVDVVVVVVAGEVVVGVACGRWVDPESASLIKSVVGGTQRRRCEGVLLNSCFFLSVYVV
jgi:hypothetical protein